MLEKVKRIFSKDGQKELLRIAKNSIFNGGAKIFSKGISLIISIIMARTIGVSGSGQYAIAVTYAGIFFVLLNFGIYSIVQREIAKDLSRASEYISNSLGLLLYISIPVAVTVGIAIKYVLNLNTSYLLMILACVYCGLTGVFTLLSNALEGLDHFDIECKATIIYNLATLVLAFPVLIIGRKIEYLIMMYVIVFVISDVILAITINRKFCKVRISFNPVFIKSLLNMSMPLVLSSASEYINLKADTLILGSEKGDRDTGLYSTAVNIYQGISCIPQAVASAFMPSFVRTYTTDKKKGKQLFAKSFSLFFILLVFIALALIVCSKFLIVLLYGKDFVEAAVPLSILGIALIPMETNRFFNNALIAMGRQKVVGISIFIGTIVNVVSNLALIPLFSYVAAAYTTLATECIVAMIDLIFIVLEFRKD